MACKGLLAGFWLILVPAASGAMFLRKKEKIAFSESFMAGYLFLFASMELLVLPMIYLKMSLHVLVRIYGGLLILAFLTGLGLLCKRSLDRKRKKKNRKNPDIRERVRQKIKETSPWFWMAGVLILLQIAAVSMTAHFDADDAMYVGAASTAVETDTIYSVNPYTGFDYTVLPSRYVLSPFPVFLAVISRLCLGLHPGIVAHMIFPAVFLLMAYLVQNLLGQKWFPGDKDAQGMYLVFLAVLMWFSAYSVYNAGNFQMVRIWQGKALLCSTLLPFVFYLCLTIMIRKEQEYSWMLLGMAAVSCCLLSSMGIMLAPLMIGLAAFVSLVYQRRPFFVIMAFLCCVPSLILGAVYIWIK